ncbi:DUF7282 domain-containing protein [Halopelagius fulvigenes]|uniref:DUF7282 domain-containing protein n=1 Tax=Halopelagius fulvigenes TaxID=1198324 RepID=A0ABD5U459_9EURY
MDDTNNRDERASEESSDGIGPKTSRRTFLSASAVGLTTAGIAASSASVAAGGDDSNGDDSNGDDNGHDEEDEPFATVEFSNQMADENTVVVNSTVLSEGGFVAIHDARLFEGKVAESVVGVSEYLEAGAHYSVDVDLFTGVPGREFSDEESSLSEGDPLVAMPHLDTNDNDTYDFVSSGGSEDGPYVDNGHPVVDLGLAGMEDDEDSFALLDFENQCTEGEEVELDDVTLSEGGFVAIHDARLLEGQVTESVIGVSEYLEAGEHDEIEVELFDVEGADFDDDRLYSDQPLIPMPHYDTNDNETYDFVSSGGEEDGPFTENGQAVVDLGFALVVEDKDEYEDDDEDEEKEKHEKKENGNGDNGNGDNGNGDNGNDDHGNGDNGNDDHGTTENGTTENGTTENGTTTHVSTSN